MHTCSVLASSKFFCSDRGTVDFDSESYVFFLVKTMDTIKFKVLTVLSNSDEMRYIEAIVLNLNLKS